MRNLAFAIALLLPGLARAEPLSWVIMPARAVYPPPQDPTLLRLTEPVAKVLAAAVGGQVRVAKRTERDARCEDEGWRCPDEIAALLSVDRVISLQLGEDLETLAVYVYGGRRGVVAEAKIECQLSGGRLACDEAALAKFASTLAPKGLEASAVFEAFEGLEARLTGCLRHGRSKPGVQVTFRVSPSGRAHSARIEPRRLQRNKVYACMSRVVEGLEVPPFAGKEAGPFTFALPERRAAATK